MRAVSAFAGRPLASLARRSCARGCPAAAAALAVAPGSTVAVRAFASSSSSPAPPAPPRSPIATAAPGSTRWRRPRPAPRLERALAAGSLPRRCGGRSMPARRASAGAAKEQVRQAAPQEQQQQRQQRQRAATVPRVQIENDSVFTARRQGDGSIANAFDLHTLKGHEGHGAWDSLKQTARFYWKGLLRVYANDREAAALRLKSPMQWSRAEFALIHRAAEDKRRVYPFAVLALLAPEAIPFVLAFAPNMIPSTCVKPELEAGRRLKLYAARQKIASGMRELAKDLQVVNPNDFSDVNKTLQHASTFEKDFDIGYLDEERLRYYCKFLGLASWGTELVLRKRLRRRLNFLREEDKYIAAEGIDQLPITELGYACDNRGISSAKSNPERLRSELSRWVSLSTARVGSVLPNGDAAGAPAGGAAVTVASFSKGDAAVQSPMLVFIQMFRHDTME